MKCKLCDIRDSRHMACCSLTKSKVCNLLDIHVGCKMISIDVFSVILIFVVLFYCNIYSF